ncbi:MAG: hypothetical protein KAI24_01740 [Planctomycetes bacterium]|nr:hypothetical protein [Planctomycetota bacterium]
MSAVVRAFVRSVLLCLAAGSMAGAIAAQELAGTWFTSRGVLELEPDGDGFRGSYGDGKSVTVEKKGRTLRFEATEGRASLTGSWQLDKGGYRFEGEWRSQRGGSGTWRGWRHDPASEKGRAAKVAGCWRTSWGLLELEQKGARLTGGFGAQGWSKVEGKLTGRHAELEYESPFGKGTWRIDFDKKGPLAFGHAANARGKYALQLQRLEGHERGVAPVAGKVVGGLADNRMVYYLRAPKGYRRGDELPLLVILHGSNYVSKPYVESIGGTEIGERFLVVGIDGEAWEDWSKPGEPRQNYTYVNFMGKSTYRGYPNTHRESPALVAEVLGELKRRHGTTRTFVGGHSQGGFLTWFLAMHYPELVDGVFPMSSGMTMQCEADVFDDEQLRAQQRRVAIAVVHGRNDPTVPFSQGEGTFLRTREHGFPRLRLFANGSGHGFSGLPWIDAVRWLEALTSDDPETLVAQARAALDEDRFRDATAFIARLREVAPEHAAAAKLAAVVDEYAEGDLERFTKAVAEPGDGSWIDDFLAWRADYEFADCAQPLMAAFARLRAQHEGPADKLMGEARGLFNQGQRDAGWKKYEELVATCWASSSYASVKGWLKNRK